MYRKVMLSCVFAISIVAIVGTEAVARVCVLRSSSGTCLYYSGSVECDLNADQIGPLSSEPKLSCIVTPSTLPDSEGLLLCGNPGAKKTASPGVQIVHVPGPESPSFIISTWLITKNDIKGGVAYADFKTFADLSDFNSFCPNLGWVALDYVPCEATIKAEQSDNISIVDSKTFSCALQSCSTLTYGLTVNGPRFERRPYQCTPQ
jgi:hypothetical protein